MVAWYWCLHSWNRILPSSVVVALATMAVLGTITTERVIVMPFVAAFVWACGWAVIAAWRLVRAPRESGFCATLSNFVRIHLIQV